MTAKRLTDLMIERSRVGGDGRTVLWDVIEAGLGVRIGAKSRSFVLKLRAGGRQRMVSIGRHPALDVAAARKAARKIKERVALGLAPEEDAAPERTPSALRSVAELVEFYVESHVRPNQRSWRDTARHLRNDLVGQLGRRPIASVAKADVVAVVNRARARGAHYGANRLLAHTKRFLSWCVEQDLIEISPARGVKPPMVEKSRDRVLEAAELGAIWRAAEALGYPNGPAIQLLMLTGQRRDEVGRMRWADLDLDAALWTIPAARNKSGRIHVVPLSRLALDTLAAVPRSDGFVFWGRAPDTAINGWSIVKKRLDARAEVENWRIHDLRRTAATGMARLGFDPHVVERVLNHATSAAGPLSRVYQRYGYEDEKRAALDRWAVEVERIVASEDG